MRSRSPHHVAWLSTVALCAALGALSLPGLPEARAQTPASTVARAEQLFNQGKSREAVIALRKDAKANLSNPRARVLLARVYLDLRQGVPAQTEIEAARRLGVSRDDSRALMAEALVLQGKYSDALLEAKEDAVPSRSASEAARVRALAQAGLKSNDAARAELDKAEQLDPNNVRAKVDRARFLAAARDIPGATAAVDAALRLQPTNVRALLVKGDLTRGTQGLAKALAYFNQALQIDPANFEALLERAATYVDLRREPEARADLQKVFAIAPNHPLGLYLEAVMRARARDFQGAQGLMTRTKGALDGYPPANLLQGVIAFESNNIEQSQAFLKKVIDASPNSLVAQRLYGATQMRLGDADGAIRTLKPLFDRGQADSRLLSLMGSAYAKKGDFNQAQKFFEEAVAAEPNQQALRTQLAMTRVATGDNQGATRDLQDVLRVDPKSLQALLMVTLIDLRSGNFKVAQQSAQRLVTTYPKLPIAYNMLGAAYLGLNNLKVAEGNFRKALDLKADYHEARRNLAQLLVAQRRFPEAKRELLRVLDTDRGNVKTMLALSNLAALDNKTDERLDWLRKAVAASPQDISPRLALVQTYLKLNDNRRALSEAADLERNFPQDARALEALGNAQALNKQYTSAVSTFTRIINLLPNNVNARILLARAQVANKQYAEARGTYQRALSLQNQNIAPVLSDLINFEANQKNFDVAIGYANQLRKQFPKQNVADVTIGNLYMGARDYNKAAQAYEAAKKIQFDRATAISLSQAYIGAKQPDKGIAVLKEWRAKAPGDITSQVAIADIYMSQKQYDAALAEYQALLKKAPKNPAILNNIAFVFDLKKNPKAVIVAEGAYKLAPTSPEIADTLGWILVKNNKDVKRGLLLLQQAAAKRPNNPDVLYHQAVAYRANGRVRDAVTALESLLAKYKQFDSLAAARATLADIKAKGR